MTNNNCRGAAQVGRSGGAAATNNTVAPPFNAMMGWWY